MTIQQAIKSGKPFRRSSWTDDVWLAEPCYDDIVFTDAKNPDHLIDITIRDIMADDWAINEQQCDRKCNVK